MLLDDILFALLAINTNGFLEEDFLIFQFICIKTSRSWLLQSKFRGTQFDFNLLFFVCGIFSYQSTNYEVTEKSFPYNFDLDS